MYKYEAKFNLIAPVININDAREYLSDDDMTYYLHRHLPFTKNLIENVEWRLNDNESGVIVVISNAALTDCQKSEISNWIRGQNSDGIGEGFEQQDFAYYHDPEADDEDMEIDTYIMASFDWETNNYELELI